MATVSSFQYYFIGLGAPSTTVSTLQLLGVGQAGTRGALRTLTHPDDANFPPITYALNPRRTTNLDNEVLRALQSEVVQTLEGSQVIRNDQQLSDVVVTETWEAGGARLAMPTFFARMLWEYAANRPAFSVTAPEYIVWAPRDRSDKEYNVEIVDFRVGGASARQSKFDFDEICASPELTDSEVSGTPFGAYEVSPTGFLRVTVQLVMKMISEAA